MDFRARLTAVLNHQAPDQVPFAPYANLIPRGTFEREMRSRGMGLLHRCSSIWSEVRGVTTEQHQEGDCEVTVYRTPVGEVCTRMRRHLGRISDSEDLMMEGMIKGPADYDPVIYMLDNTVFHLDPGVYNNAVRDWGSDGLVRDTGLDMESVPYGSTRRYFGDAYGLETWVYEQRDHPDHFQRLLEAQERRDERRLALVEQLPGDLIAFGWMEALWSAEKFRQYELPFYKKWVPYLQSKGKKCVLHCDATRNLGSYVDVIRETGIAVVEAITPPPVGALTIPQLRQAWGEETVIWINFPETVFWSGRDAAFQYTKELIQSDPPGNALVISFTEMGVWGATDDATEMAFKEGTRAIMDAIEQYGNYPVRG